MDYSKRQTFYADTDVTIPDDGQVYLIVDNTYSRNPVFLINNENVLPAEEGQYTLLSANVTNHNSNNTWIMTFPVKKNDIIHLSFGQLYGWFPTTSLLYYIPYKK